MIIGFTYGIKSGYDNINLQTTPTTHDASHKNQYNYYYKEVNYPGRTALEIYIPLSLRNWFESKYY